MQPPTPKPVTFETIKAEAKKYHDLGIAVIPFVITWDHKKGQYKKDNIGTWKKWETEIQTEEEFKNIYWSKNGQQANGFGVILGTKAKNGFYLSVIDYDVKGKVSEEAKKLVTKSYNEIEAFPEDLKFYEMASALSAKSFNMLVNEFAIWALGKLLPTVAIISEEIDESIWKDLQGNPEQKEEETGEDIGNQMG